MNRERLQDIDRAKGLAIFFFLLGHLTLGSRPADNDWYIFLETLIYKFHMPFFMFISGFVFLYSFPEEMKSAKDYLIFIKRRFIRLMPAFFLFSVLICAGKILFDAFLLVDNIPASFIEGITKIIFTPTVSSGKSLWYVYVLFLYQLIFVPLIIVFRKRLSLLLLLGALIHLCYIFKIILPATNYFAMDHAKQYFLAFSLGIFLASNRNTYIKLIDKYHYTFIFMFLGSFFILMFGVNLSFDISHSISKLVIGILSIPALHSLVRSPLFDDSNILLALGKYTFPIYLMNTIAIGLTKGIILKFVTWDGPNFVFIAPILLFSGIFIPILIKKYIFPKVRALDIIIN